MTSGDGHRLHSGAEGGNDAVGSGHFQQQGWQGCGGPSWWDGHAQPGMPGMSVPPQYSSPWTEGKGGAAVPPPPQLQHPNRRGGANMADGILVSNLPPELRSMNALHHHFRRFGEILKLTIQNAEGKAFVQFADQSSAEAAKNEPVLGCGSVEINFVLRDRAKRGCGRGRARGRGESGPSAPPEGIQNRVLVTDPEERRRVEDATRKKDEISSRKRELQQQLTEQLKVLMVKLQDKELSEDRRESYKALLLKIKGRLNVLSGVASATTTFEAPAARLRARGLCQRCVVLHCR